MSMSQRSLLYITMSFWLAGCASVPAELTQHNSAHLVFANQAAASGIPGWFSAIDGRQISGTPTAIRVPPGTHTISYSCPDHITLDQHPTVRGTFRAGAEYALECGQSVRIFERGL